MEGDYKVAEGEGKGEMKGNEKGEGTGKTNFVYSRLHEALLVNR